MDLEEKIVERTPKIFLRVGFFSRLGEKFQRMAGRGGKQA